ncbi:caspase domain-containing protein [Armillaria luteobubalina]|uniref:Caspase domain-containing protein n=1 Tax=Armillaria luteobubalina TaxID=153913 RepID=A0AA39P291_9AGAR|nr:caspase domain-containing protein [Armillaria luteobubalina]
MRNSKVWAVLIGIDGYKTAPLSGCVSDARLMEDYLTSVQQVKKDHIQLLLGPLGENAGIPSDSLPPTRKNIIDTLLSLANNNRIERGSDIIIYYAGHGASRPSPTGSVEYLCPIDRDSETDRLDIIDRQINEILYKISLSQGNRITVILDCCYSAGATRANDLGGKSYRFRSVPPLPGVSVDYELCAANEDMRLSGSD